jgi:hypothetical protein
MKSEKKSSRKKLEKVLGIKRVTEIIIESINTSNIFYTLKVK